MKYGNIRNQVLEAILEAAERGLIRDGSGSIAMKDANDPVVAVTPNQVPFKKLTPDQIAITDMRGNRIDGPFEPSSEVLLHTVVLHARKDVNATVHTHSMFATIAAMSDDLLPTMPSHAGVVPVGKAGFYLPGSQKLAEMVLEALQETGHSVLMENHGMFCCGQDMRQALEMTSYTEEMARIAYYAKLAGIFKPMPEDAVRILKEQMADRLAV